MQEHEYKARDKTVQKMSRDGLREENLRNKEEKRITGRDMDTEVSRSEKKDELDFSKRRREHINEKRETEHPEQSSKKTRYSRESVLDEESEQDIDGKLDGEQVADESTAATKSAFRSESIRGQPRGERAYLETVADSRDLRKKKMVRDYASKERRKEKEASEESKTAKREAARYRETSEVAEESLDGFSEEIKGKSKRERVLKEQQKKSSRLSFGDESDGMVHGAGIGIRSSASAVKDAAATALYGSRAANGVVVITTVAPQMGKLNVSFYFTGDVTVPDLSDYNLMNAREKLETEVAAGVFEDLAKDNPLGAEQQNYAKLASITRGVDTYWLSKPLQTSFNHKHSLSIDGGSDNFRFGIQLSYNNEDGVMKESFRNRVGAGVYLDYRIGSFQLKNMVT